MRQRWMGRLLAVLMCGALSGLVGCSEVGAFGSIDEAASREQVSAITERSTLGIIETRTNIDKSRIVFYDADLECVGSLPLGIAQVEQVWGDLPQVDSYIYVAPYGNFKDGQGHEVLQIDRRDLTITPFDVDEKVLNGAAANDRYVYAYNDLNGVSTISRCEKESGEIKKLSIPDDHITSAVFSEGSLWVFAQHQDFVGQQEEEQAGLLYKFDENLEEIAVYDISACGSGQYRTIACEGKLYFTSLGKARGCNLRRVGVFDTATNELDWYQLEKDYPNAMVFLGDKLLVSHCDVIAGRNVGGYLSICDTATSEVETLELTHDAVEMAVSDGTLYILDSWQRKLYAYDADSFKLKSSVAIDYMDEEFSYLSNIFVMGDGEAE